MTIIVTITSQRELAGVAAAAAAATAAAQAADPDAPAITPEQYLQAVLDGACESYREQFAVDRITSSAFVARFTVQEYADIRASSDPVLQGFVARVESEPYVWLGSDEVQQGMAYVVAQGLLTQARADEILAY